MFKYPDEVIRIITEGRAERVCNTIIAQKLNEKGYKTQTGKIWSESNVSNVAINHCGLPRTFNRRDPDTQRKSRKRNQQPSLPDNSDKVYQAMEDIFSSNLSEDSKKLLVKSLSKEL